MPEFLETAPRLFIGGPLHGRWTSSAEPSFKWMAPGESKLYEYTATVRHVTAMYQPIANVMAFVLTKEFVVNG